MLRMDFDAVLSAHVGEWGRGQLLILLAASAGWASLAICVLSMVFVTQSPTWSCTSPQEAVCHALALRQQHDPTALCSLNQTQFVFDQPHASLISTFGLTCGNSWKVGWSNAILFCGYAVGASVFGWMADTHGRKTALVASCVSTAAVTLVCAAATSYSWYLAGRFLQGVCVSGLPIAAYVLSTESVGPAYRGRAGTASQLIYHFGEWVLPLMALALQDWRLLYAAIAACCLVTALLAMLVPESPRWQLLHGRNTQAGVRTLQWMARLNGRQLPESLAQQLLAESGAGPGGSQGQQGEAAAAAAASAQADANDGSSRSKATAAAGLSGQQQGEEDCHSGGGQQQQDQDQDDDCVALLAIAADQARQPKEVGQQQQQHAEVLSEDVQERRQEDLSSSSSGGVGAGAGSHAPHKPDSVWLVFSDPLLARLFWVSAWLCTVMAVGFFTANLATEKLQGSLYVNFFVTSIGELPATIIGALAVDAIGRRPTIATGLLVTGIACSVCALLQPGPWATTLASLGKAACSSAWSLAYIYAAELMPTSVRSAALAGSNQAARLGGAVAPFIIYAGERLHHPKMPFALVGVMSSVTALLTFCLPETRGKRQPDSMDDLQQLYGGGSSSGRGGSSDGGDAVHGSAGLDGSVAASEGVEERGQLLGGCCNATGGGHNSSSRGQQLLRQQEGAGAGGTGSFRSQGSGLLQRLLSRSSSSIGRSRSFNWREPGEQQLQREDSELAAIVTHAEGAETAHVDSSS